ncbi:hypothetical protein [Alkaliphilus oremlandii]|uniref:GAF domain-containing protein n=1 Tax=Alkaliphilus oremlandii (strain OhILAs) TaxID=350688 RepID=A8MEV5_ALKOO|nr:hypothetical protein [Alkaliphilus oremlandii]ABW18434.1 hypothetical protein Clos_0887 [Alkaliphilus oremlandii OhILAs]
MIEVLKNMFNEIGSVVELEEIAYLTIENGELIPIYKNDTEFLPLQKWIDFHKEYRSFVKDAEFLMKLVETKSLCAIHNTDHLDTKPTEFKVLDIRSIYLFPIIKKDTVVAVVDMAFIKKNYVLSEEQIKQCEHIINKNIHMLIEN